MKVLKDLQGNPYKFYRGKGCEYISKGCFFCNCFDIAKSYRVYDETPIIEAEIAVRNPLVIDATLQNGHSYYDYLSVCDCKLYPEEKRESLIRHIRKVGGTDTLSTDEVLEWAIAEKDIDAVIVKNVREGINAEFPVYDVMVWNSENLLNERNVMLEEQEFEIFRKNTFKRVDLSTYIFENEQDGVVNITIGEGYVVEHVIKRNGTKWYMGHELVISSSIPVEVYCLDTQKYVTGELLENGIYENTAGMTPCRNFIPCNDKIRIKGMMQNCKYRIDTYSLK